METRYDSKVRRPTGDEEGVKGAREHRQMRYVQFLECTSNRRESRSAPATAGPMLGVLNVISTQDPPFSDRHPISTSYRRATSQ